MYLLDSTAVSLPDAQRDRFPGCGGSHGGGRAAMKLQTLWELRGGALQAVRVEAGRDGDSKTPLQAAPLAPGALRIADLGDFDTAVLQQLAGAGASVLSRLWYGTAAFAPGDRPLPLLAWLAPQAGPFVDQRVLVGTERKVACRIIAWRVPAEQANRRRPALIAEARRRDGRTPSRERPAWCDWTILVTNAPPGTLTPTEAAVLYRARWQVETCQAHDTSSGRWCEAPGAGYHRRRRAA